MNVKGEELKRKMCRDLIMGITGIDRIIRSAPYRYKAYAIPKRGGGTRKISQPAKEVKVIQYWLCCNVLDKAPIHSAARAYKQGLGLIDNVRPHSQNSHFVKIDFQSFFPSIEPFDLISSLEAAGLELDEDAVFILSRSLFCWERTNKRLCLSIGAPSSPLISNIVMFKFDEMAAAIAMNRHGVYTRYADDLTFSSSHKYALDGVLDDVRSIIHEIRWPRLKINPKKLVYASSASRCSVTGLNITPNGEISIGRTAKRYLKGAIFRIKQGKDTSAEEISWVVGYLAYLRSVESSFFASLRQKYGRMPSVGLE